jgi:ABC-type phosphate/phosphonate transport system ATPase subunit
VTALVDVSELRARGRSGVALGPVSFALAAGEALAVTGPHAAGKSLLLSCIARLAPSTSARLVRPERIAMIFQRDALDDGRTALENVLVGAHRLPPVQARARAHEELVRVGLAEHAHQRPRSLSGGMRKRVGIARALASSPSLILADDPTAGLDPHTAREVLDALFLSMQTAAVLIATTDVDVVLPRAPRTLFLDNGRAVSLGPTEALANEPATRAFAPRILEESAWM